MEVACATDDAYAPHCATMLQSLLAHPRAGEITVHLLHGPSLPTTTLGTLRAFVTARGARLSALPVTDDLMRGFPDRRFHPACWYRILLPTLLPTTPRVLYLDADLLVLDDLNALWETDLGGNAFGATINPLYPFMKDHQRQLGLSDPRDYLNSGVMLMDLDAMRAEGVQARILAYARQHPDNPWPEQDALSVVCKGRWLRLPPRWNAQTTLFDLPGRDLPFDHDQIVAARQRPATVHFIGPHKPWHYLCRHPLRHRYAEFRRATPWPDFALEGHSLRNAVLRPMSLAWQLRALRLAGSLRSIARVVRRRALRGPLTMKAFAQNFRDATFVQVGSNDGAKHDPLHEAFLKSDWTGVMVEPVPYVFERLRENYGRFGRVRLENVAVAVESGSLPFYYVAQSQDPGLPSWYDELGSFRRDVVMKHADQIPGLEARVVRTEVPCVTFEELCRRSGIAHVDLVHIDAEGYDGKILGTIDLRHYRPVLLIYEHKHLGDQERQACRDRLHRSGYRTFEEDADTWAVDARARGPAHRRFLRTWTALGWVTAAR